MQEELELYRTIFAAYPDALLLVDPRGTIVLANPAAAKLFGYDADELSGMSVDDLVPDATRSRHAAYRESYAAAPRPRPMGTNMDLVARRRDGREVQVEIALSPLQEAGLPYVVAAVRGIGEYPRVKQALRRAKYSEAVAQLGRLAVDTLDVKVLLDHVPRFAAETFNVDVAVVYLIEQDGNHLKLAAGLGLHRDEVVGRRLPNDENTPAGYLMKHGRPLVIEDLSKETRFVVPPAFVDAGVRSTLAVPLLDRGRTIGVLAVRSREPARFGDDELRALESMGSVLATSLQRAHSEAALNHSQRLESVGQLTGGIAHDFNNLLTIIHGNLQVLEDHPALAGHPSAQQLLAAAMRAASRGAELTSKLLAFSRRQLLTPSKVDVNALLESLADMLRRTLDQRIRIAVDAPRDHVWVVADAGQLESALLNTAINARDAMPDGGTLRFACRRGDALPPDVAAELGAAGRDPDAWVSIDVQDTGHGMSEEVSRRAFEPFFTTKESGRGTGLGLSTTHGFVKQSHGAVRLRTAPGEGTTITLVLPRYRDADAKREAGVAAASTLPRGLKVLLVEDDGEVRKVVRAFLHGLGCDTTEFSNAEQALASLEAVSDYDLLLTDIVLGPGLRGTELARRVRAGWPGIAVLLMSGYASRQEEGDDTAGVELLRKPYGKNELAAAIARAVAAE